MTDIAPQVRDNNTGSDPTSVYRYYDRIGILIYVGITRQGMGRNAQHNGKAEWWPFVARQEVEHYPTRGAAAMREKELIRGHRPPFNKQHNHDYEVSRAAYLAYAHTFSGHLESPHDLYVAVDKRLPMDISVYEPGLLVLRSRLEHGPLTTLMQKMPADPQPRVRSARRSYGQLAKIEVFGPTLLVTCQLRMSKKAIQPEGGIVAAELLLGWSSKPAAPYIRSVVVTEGLPSRRPVQGVRRYGPDTVEIRKVAS